MKVCSKITSYTCPFKNLLKSWLSRYSLKSIKHDILPLHSITKATRLLTMDCDRLVLRKHVHKKTIIHGGKEETLVTETTHVEQDSDPPPDMSASIDQVIRQFMASDAFGSTSGSVTLTIAAPTSPTSALQPSSSEPHE